MQAGHLFIQLLGQGVDIVVMRLAGQFDLGQALVGETVAHHEAGVAGGTTQVHQTAFGQNDHGTAGLEGPFVYLGLDILTTARRRGLEVSHIDFVVEMADVADDGFVLHLLHVGAVDHVVVAGGRNENIAEGGSVFHRDHLETLHGRLQGANGINLGYHHAGPVAPHRTGTALTYVAVAADHHDFAGHHDVGGPFDAVGQGFTAAVEVVEFGLGDRIVDIDGRKEQLSVAGQLVETVDPGGRLLGHTADFGRHPLPAFGILVIALFQAGHQDFHIRIVVDIIQQRGIFLDLDPLVDEHGGVSAVVHNQVGAGAVRPGEGHFSTPPVFLEGLFLPGKHGCGAVGGDGGGGMVLGREDVAAGPADIGPQGRQRFDQHGGLDGHMKAAGHLQALERLFNTVFRPDGH